MDCVIRAMRPEERGLMEDFLYEAIFVPEGEAPPERSILARPELRVYVDGFGTGAADACLVAEVEGAVIGMAWTRIMNDYGHVDDETPSLAIALREPWRGRGIGTALLAGLLKRLAEAGYARASLSVQKANRAAKLYRRLGFRELEARDGEAIMACDLKNTRA